MAEQAASSQENDTQPHFSVQRVYLKDASYEAPGVPRILGKEWQPEVNLDLNTRTSKLNEDHYEVVVTVTVTSKSAGETAFLIEVQQAGLFRIQNVDKKQLQHTLGVFCPSMLFPYAREAVDNLAMKGSFPPLMLSPVNFEALYNEQIAKAQAETH